MTGRVGRYSDLLQAAERAVDELQQRPRDIERRIERLIDRLRENPLYFIDKIPRKPRAAVLELTLRCNMRCRHCGSAAGKARPQELDLDEWKRVGDDLARLGGRMFTLLGGEPLISPHWKPLASHLSEAGIWVNAITNGWTLSDPRVADRVAGSALRSLGLSIDGKPEQHDELRGRPGSFTRIEDGIRMLQQRGYTELSAITCVTRTNLYQLPWLHGFLTDIGIKRWRLQICVPEGRMCRSDPVVLRPEDLPRLVAFFRQFRARSKLEMDAADNIGYFAGCEEVVRSRFGRVRFWTGCTAGLQTIGITSDGGVVGCLSFPAQAPWIEGNVREKSVADIWNDPEAFKYNRRFDIERLQGSCRGCHYSPLCRAGCLSSNLGYTGELFHNPYCLEHRMG